MRLAWSGWAGFCSWLSEFGAADLPKQADIFVPDGAVYPGDRSSIHQRGAPGGNRAVGPQGQVEVVPGRDRDNVSEISWDISLPRVV